MLGWASLNLIALVFGVMIYECTGFDELPDDLENPWNWSPHLLFRWRAAVR